MFMATAVLGDQTGALLGISARACRWRFDNHLHFTGVGHREHAEAEPSAQIAISRVALASLATSGHLGGKPHLVARAGAINRLQHQFKIKG